MLPRPRAAILSAALLALLAFASTAVAPASRARAAAPIDFHVTAHSPLHRLGGAASGARQAVLQPQGYIPCDVWGAYGMGTVDANTGAGQTIAIIDPYDAPTAGSDFAAFSAAFGLPTTGFTWVHPFGQNATDTTWISEVVLDIEWAHAIAPGARIVWVEALSAGSADMIAAIDYAVNTVQADVVSMSWTFTDAGLTAGQIQTLDTHLPATNGAGKSVVYTASAGDAGFQVNWPAESPAAIGVGGTSVTATGFGYSSPPASHTTCAGRSTAPGVTAANETVWGTSTGGAGTGGGVATKESLPSYQASFGIAASGRAIPDIAFLADPNTGVATYTQGTWTNPTGGTSLGAPAWAGLVARLNAARGANLSGAAWLYLPPASSFNDVITGSAPPAGGTACIAANPSCAAKPGYDYVTGRGTPLTTTLQTATGPLPYTFYFPWFDRISDPGFANDNIHVVNPSGGNAKVNVHIPGCSDQTATIPSQKEQIFTCPGGFGGPVVVTSDQKVLASQRVQYNQSFNEVKAIPGTAARQSLTFSWFDLASDPGFSSDNVHVVNPQATATSVTVRIPGCSDQTRTVDPGSFQIFSCPGGFGGPVKVDAVQPVVATQRVKYYQSFNEVAAQPAAGSGTSLFLAWYDHVSDPGFLNDNIHVIGDPGTQVKVKIANPFSSACADQTQALGSTGEAFFSCAQGFGGPVQVISTNGTSRISASQRVQYYQSFNEVAAATPSEAGTSQWISWFDLASSPGFTSDNVHVVNPSPTGSANYTVAIPGCGTQSGTVAPLQEAIVSCPGGFGGPVQVSATTPGMPLLAAARVKYYSSFNEVSGQS